MVRTNLKNLFILALGIAIILGLIFASPMLVGKSYADEIGVTSPASKRIPGSYIITLEDDTPKNFIKKEARDVNATLKKQGGHVDKVYENALKGFSVKNVKNPAVLLSDSSIATIEPDYMDQTQRQYMPNVINRIDLDRAVTTSFRPDNREGVRPNIDVAVLDERVAPNHPDLNLFKSVTFVGEQPPGSHGTHVAGTCCAKDNLGGVVGVVPGARIWSLAVCDSDPESTSAGCSNSAILAAFDYVVTNAASIETATMSVGCKPASAANCAMTSTVNNAITAMTNAGVTFFTSAGNDAMDSNDHRYCGATNAICVSSLTDLDGKCGGLAGSTDDRIATYSNFGSDVDIMSPGTRILSTWPGGLAGTFFPDDSPGGPFQYIGTSDQGFYQILSGTSMATPLAAGLGALIKLQNPSFTPTQIKTNLQSNAYSQTQSCDGFGKGGLVSGANSKSSEKILYAGNY
jgi:subtilisin